MSAENQTARPAIRVYMTGSCDGSETIRAALAAHPEIDFVGSSETITEAASALVGGHLRVVLHATRSSVLPSDEIAAIREHTSAALVLLASGEASRLLEEALASDVSDVLLLPQLPDSVVFALRKAGQTIRRPDAARAHDGTIVTVFSPKGGTGKTVLATNLASMLAKQGKKKTLLVDLDLQFGDAAIMMGVEPEKSIFDLVVAPGELDAEKLLGYTTRHACGLDMLPAPLRPEDAELVTEAKVARLLEVARSTFDVIVVDTSPFFHGPMLSTLDRTDVLLLLTALDVPTLKNVKLALQTLDLLSFPSNRIRVVLNRADSKVGMKQAEVEQALGMKVQYRIPSDRVVPLSVNMGTPVVLSDGKAEFARSIDEIAKAVFVKPGEQTKRRMFRATAKA
ncbi:MAG TPA: AAA family ATPase [Gaiellaceae bacterium]|nr:AAA family ATPase [Gaiellaceae bacterium]